MEFSCCFAAAEILFELQKHFSIATVLFIRSKLIWEVWDLKGDETILIGKFGIWITYEYCLNQ